MNEQLLKLISQYSEKLIGITNETQWSICLTRNGTYLECPIKVFKADQKMLVLVYNPSTIQQHYVEIKLPHGKFKASYYNTMSKLYEEVD